MSDFHIHPESERLNAFVEGDLEADAETSLGAHLTTCSRCRSEVDELRTMFDMLSDLTHFAPAAGFADRVMAGVRVRQPWHARAAEWLERLAPQTTRGWVVATAMVALPAIALTALSWWVLSRPGVTAQGLWVISTDFGGEALNTAWAWLWSHLTSSALAAWAGSVGGLLESLGRGGIGLGLVMFVTLTAASIWILYNNLFRSESRRTDYASYVF